MKRKLFPFHIGLASMAIILSSCQKDLDTVRQRDDVMGTSLPSTTTYCRIESIRENPGTANGRIGSDENHIWANSASCVPTVYFELEESTFDYDSKERISRVETHRLIHPNVSITNYNYDVAGNLIRPRLAYDNKAPPSFARFSVWQKFLLLSPL